jgi:uncharacterized protein with GYD domain
MEHNTYIILCRFVQSELDELVADGEKLKKQAEDVGHELTDVKVKDMWLTTGGHQVVAVVEAPSLERARDFLDIFKDIGTPQVMVRIATGDIGAGIVSAFNGHTKM